MQIMYLTPHSPTPDSLIFFQIYYVSSNSDIFFLLLFFKKIDTEINQITI